MILIQDCGEIYNFQLNFCNMEINKNNRDWNILIQQNCKYEFNASIDFWLKTTIEVNVSC